MLSMMDKKVSDYPQRYCRNQYCNCNGSCIKEWKKAKETHKGEYTDDERREHLRRVMELQKQRTDPRPKRECLHNKCPSCKGTGVKIDGTVCIHMISCPCPKCNVFYYAAPTVYGL